MLQALDRIRALRERASKVSVAGNREYNPGWHTAIDLHNLLTVSEAITKAAILRKESRGGHFRDDYPKKDTPKFGRVNSVIAKGPNGEMQIRLEAIAPMPQELKDAIAAEAGGQLPEEL
jgi:succinate dehydrogenase / fumarate reductase flavoprotein subunit